MIGWSRETWLLEVGPTVARQTEPVAALLALARGTPSTAGGTSPRMPIALRLEFAGQDHPVAREVEDTYRRLIDRCAGLIDAARARESIPAGPPTDVLALAVVGALEGALIGRAGHAAHDEVLAVRAVTGVLGLHGAGPEPDSGPDQEA